ncbi:hypothetical protein HU772_022590 [Pseudomonas xantholysinigenes]|uniref:Uncharacterized protein n=1 Tax=Pseudomonas xantholysinigenes TaxID=2745490 RepID=A0A9E6TX51_9PSED|nr:hypothetical protein [Pseudomonas xantholysinigenes]QXI38079.1 hypothetical protein HU772_022590 [Pseudomonas xantholysinigenes]
MHREAGVVAGLEQREVIMAARHFPGEEITRGLELADIADTDAARLQEKIPTKDQELDGGLFVDVAGLMAF